MTPVISKSENEDFRDEECNGQEQEVALPSPHHPEEPEGEDDDDDEEEVPSANNRRTSRCNARSLVSVLATAGVVVATLSAGLHAASSKTNPSLGSNINIQAAAAAQDLPGYVQVGSGICLDDVTAEYPSISFTVDVTTPAGVQDCANQCGCVERYAASNGGAVTFRGMYVKAPRDCDCLVDGPLEKAILENLAFSATCNAETFQGNILPGNGEIMSSTGGAPFASCFKFVGGGSSKTGKTKAGKAED